MPLPALLLLIVFLEGYVVLSVELLAIRSLIPFIGAGTDTVSIIIAAVLMPLALGYYTGGRYALGRIRQKLLVNWCIAAAILGPALSYPFMTWFFKSPYMLLGWDNRIILAALYTGLFIAGPVYLLGQTVPLLSNYFPRARIASLTGRILFVSTLGSFMGAVFCTLVLMTYFGVHYAVSISIACLVCMVFLLARRLISVWSLAAAACLILTLAMNSSALLAQYDIVANNRYNVVQVSDFGASLSFRVNSSLSSMIFHDGREDSSYINYMQQIFINAPSLADKNVLVIGAGGFTIGEHDAENTYTFVDLDPGLKGLAEKYFLKHPLSPNKTYKPVEARSFLSTTHEKYDVVILDAFNGLSLAPEHLVTREFYGQVKSVLKPGGVFAANYIVSPVFSDLFSRRLDNTLRTVFPNLNRQVLSRNNVWNNPYANVIYSYFYYPGADRDDTIYTDDRNTSLFDKPVKLP